MAVRTGILGGTFDPPHAGHVAMAVAAIRSGLVDELLVVPAGDPWQKSAVTAAEHRLAMCRLAFADLPAVSVSDLETTRAGATYAIDTVDALTRPDRELLYVVGADALANLPSWHRIGELVERVTFLVVERPHTPLVIPPLPGLRLEYLAMQPVDASSTDIRGGAAERLPDAVRAYAAGHGLYGLDRE